MIAADDVYPSLRDCWLTGASAVSRAPEEWQSLLDDADPTQAELRLLALTGQLRDVALRPVPPASASTRPDLPPLDRLPMPDAARPLFRALASQGWRAKALQMADARGFRAHPLDWFPAASTEDLPDTYLPWQDWVRGFGGEAVTADDLTDDTWPYSTPGARITALKAMRGDEPGRARDLIANHLAGESAEVRLALVRVLQVSLGPDDVPFLSGLATDKSPKVKTLAASLLGRLGVGAGQETDLAELAGFFKVSVTGVFKKTATITAAPTKTNAQRQRRNELMEHATVANLAAALGIEPDDLIDGADLDEQATLVFVGLVARTGTDAQADRLAGRLVRKWPASAMDLIPRATPGMRRLAMDTLLNKSQSDGRFALHLLTQLEPDLAEPAALIHCHALDAIVARLEADNRQDLFPLSFVCTPAAAAAVLDKLIKAGVRPHDPWLSPLRFNLALAQPDKET